MLCDNLVFLSLFHLSVQEVKRAVVGFFTSNDTTAYMSFAKVSHIFIIIPLART